MLAILGVDTTSLEKPTLCEMLSAKSDSAASEGMQEARTICGGLADERQMKLSDIQAHVFARCTL